MAATPGGTGRAAGLSGPLCHGEQPRLEGKGMARAPLSSSAHLHCQHVARIRSGRTDPHPSAAPRSPCSSHRHQLGSAPQVLQVPRAARKEVLDLRPGARYHAQVRAQPSGPWYQGSWSAWSEPVVVDAMANAGKGQGRSGDCSQRSHVAEGRRLSAGNGMGSVGQRVTGLQRAQWRQV